MRTVRAYLKDLAELGIVVFDGDRSYRLISKQISSFGPTLEWYVSEILQREFMAPALFNVRLQNTCHGGDYDVIALVGGHLVYVEVKSSPPRGVELPAVSAFLNRLGDLQPQMAVFLVDTELRMKDKIVELFSEAVAVDHEPAGLYEVERLVDEIFHIRHAVYLVNSRKGIYSNLRTCFRDFLHADNRPRAFVYTHAS
jgi:Holliday junction resolvase-like predicted endonuclease